MRLFRSEWKKTFLPDSFLLVFAVCFFGSFAILWFGAHTGWMGDLFAPSAYVTLAEKVKTMPESSVEEYLESSDEIDVSLCQVMQEEWNGTQNYAGYLKRIRDGISSGLRGHAKDSYQQRLQQWYQSNYSGLEADRVTFIGGRGILLFCHTDITEVWGVLWIVLVVFRLVIYETESGMGCLNAASMKGGAALTRTKWLLGGVIVFLGLAFVYGYKLYLYTSLYGFKDWNSAIQSIPQYMGVSREWSVLQFLVVFMVHKFLGYMCLYTVFTGLALIGQTAVSTVLWQGLFAGASIGASYGISKLSNLSVLWYMSPVRWLDQENLLAGCHAVRIGNRPVEYRYLWYAEITAVACILLVKIFHCRLGAAASRRKRHLVGKGHVFPYRVKRFRSLFLWEGRKGLLYEGGWFLFVLLGVAVLCFYRPPQEWIMDSDERYYRKVMLELQGDYTEQKRDKVANRIQKLEELQQDVEQNGDSYTAGAMQVAMEELETLDVLHQVDQYLDYLSSKEDTSIVYDKGYRLLLGEKIPGGYLLLCNILGVMWMVLLSVRLWGQEEWNRTDVLCRASRTGLRSVNRRKCGWIAVYAIAIGILVYIPWIYQCGQTYSLRYMNASAGSLMSYERFEGLSLGGLIGISYLLRICYLGLVGGITGLVQRKASSQGLTVYIALLIGIVPLFILP